jgi:ABC-type oligopeptide transport system ATPase subunit
LGGQVADTLPEAVTGRRLAYVGSSAYMFSTTVRDNLLYGVKHLPLRDAEYDDETRQATEKWRVEAIAAGNSQDDINADWIDYDAADAPDDHALLLRIIETLTMVTLDGDIYQLGLRGSIDPATQPGLAEQFLKARAEFHTRLTDPEIAALVEGFDPEKYNDNATLGENLLFGTPIGSGFDMDRLAENPYVIALLEREGLIDVLLDTGQQIASTMTELFADLPPGHPFFEQFSFISAEDLPEYQAILTRINRDSIATLRPEERTMLLSLPFKVSPARHRLGVIDHDLQQRILKARKAFAANLPEEFGGMVEFFDVNGYNAAASLQDNILFGKLAYGQARGGERVGEIIAQVIDDLGLRAAVMEVGLSFHVGNGGGRLSSAQRQKLGIARAILKRPDVLILNEATGSLDGAAQTAILAGLKQEFDGRGLIWAVHRPSMASDFDRALVMKSGRVIEQGTFEELNREGTALHDLVQAE